MYILLIGWNISFKMAMVLLIRIISFLILVALILIRLRYRGVHPRNTNAEVVEPPSRWQQCISDHILVITHTQYNVATRRT